MAVTVIIAPQAVPAGTFGPTGGRAVAAQNRPRTVLLQILSANWAGEVGLELDLQIDLSVDGGTNWNPTASAHILGGAVNSRTGALPSIGVPVPINTAVSIRGTAALSQPATSLGIGFEVIG